MPSPWLKRFDDFQLTASDVSKRLGVPVAHVYDLVKTGVLAGKRVDRMGIRTFRFRAADVDAYKERASC